MSGILNKATLVREFSSAAEASIAKDDIERDFSKDIQAGISAPKLNKKTSGSPNAESPAFQMTSPDDEFSGMSVDTRKRWQTLKDTIEASGGRVIVLDGAKASGGPREVWARDKYVLVGDTAYLADPVRAMRERPEYAGEIFQAENFLKSKGIKTVTVEGAWFEGGNVIQHPQSNTLFFGFNPDYPDNSAQLLSEAINKNSPTKISMLPVPLTHRLDANSPRRKNAYLYHLDTGMSEALPNGEVLLSPEVTDPATLELIKERIGAKNIITLSMDDTIGYSANLIAVKNTVISNMMSKGLRQDLESRGYVVKEGEDFGYTQLGFGGAGPHCEVNVLPSSTPTNGR